MTTENIRFLKLDEVAVLTFDTKNRDVNLLSRACLEELLVHLERIAHDDSIKASVIISAKAHNFIAGADINELASVESSRKAELMLKGAQGIFNQIAESPKPFVAAVHGSCFGGGFELALACHYRIATLEPKTVFAFPEVNLGLLSAAGGTQRLPRQIGVVKALKYLLTGKKIHAQEARSMGLIDFSVNLREELQSSALAFTQKILKNPKKNQKKPSFLSLLPLFFAKRSIQKKTHGHYPAPFAIIDAVKTGITHGLKAGLKVERKQFGLLSQTSVAKNLMRLFFLEKARQKSPYDTESKVERLGIVGSGLMGSGIAYVSLLRDLYVHMNDSREDALSHARESISKKLLQRTKSHDLLALDRARMLSKLSMHTDLSHFSRSDLVIEAVSEDLAIKQEVLKNLEPHLKPSCIFASNTSSIPIAKIAENSSLKDRILGMHYFSPVERMPLLEIVKAKETSQKTLATACELGIRQKKTIIVVNDSPGFYTTRIISALFDEASILLEEGHDPRQVDGRMLSLGFPVGPVTLMDEIGLDTGLHVSEVLYEYFGSNLIAANLKLIKQMVSKKFLGRKSGQGFYSYNAHKTGVNAHLRELVKPMIKKTQANATKYKIEDRMLLRMVNEAARCLSENVVMSPDDADVGAVFGLGFPPYLGGPFTYIEAIGKGTIADSLDALSQTFGDRFLKADYFSHR